jgi:hypothetical protein
VPILNTTGVTDLVGTFEQFLYQAEVQHVVAVVGPLTGDACRVTAVTSPLFQIPQVHPSFFYFFKISFHSLQYFPSGFSHSNIVRTLK